MKPTVDERERQRLFSELIARHNNELYAYIFAVVKNRADAEDLFQSVCLVLWRSFDKFRPGTSFFSWGRQTAKYVLCSFLRHKRNMPNHASEELLDAISNAAPDARDADVEAYLAALQRCKNKLSAADEQLLQLRYEENLGLRQIAERLHRLQPHVSRSLNRIRQVLFQCVQRELSREEHPRGELP